jgi:hypothetical protein
MRTCAQESKAAGQIASAASTMPGRGHPGHGSRGSPILHLQRTIGNQAVGRMIQADAEGRKAGVTGSASPRLRRGFSRIPVHPPAAIQAELAIHEPGDPYEQEADRISEQVMRMPEPRVQRARSRGGGGSGCQTEQPGPVHGRLQTRRVQASGTERIAAAPLVHEVLRAPGHPLDRATRAFMEPRIGHDFSGVRVHSDAAAGQSARGINAHAYTTGRDIVFGAGQYAPNTARGRKLLAHELTHVVQQSSSGSGARGIQRYAFVNEKQVAKSEKGLTPEMQGMVSDARVRNYTGVDEFKKHAGKQTDYLGNLADGTWMRFSPTGINLLGENHTAVSLEKVLPAVGSTNFIYEPFSSDVMKAGSNIKSAYEGENLGRFKTFGVEKEKDKQKFGAESLFPKIGFALTLARPYFEGKARMIALDPDGYLGQPLQRYLKIAWGYSKDNQLVVAQKRKAKENIPPKLDALATVHASVQGKLDKFITSLVVDGHLETELDKKANAGLFAPIAMFASAFTEVLVEMAATEKSSRLSNAERKTLSEATSTSRDDKISLFSRWRNFLFEDNVKAATKRGVRYAGMGQSHLDHLATIGLDKNQHPFEMDGKDIKAFRALTSKLTKAAKKI